MICMSQDMLSNELRTGGTAAVGAESACWAGVAAPADAASLATGGFADAKLYNAALLAAAAASFVGGAPAGALAGTLADALVGALADALAGALADELGSLAARSISLASSGERTCTV